MTFGSSEDYDEKKMVRNRKNDRQLNEMGED